MNPVLDLKMIDRILDNYQLGNLTYGEAEEMLGIAGLDETDIEIALH